MGKYDPGFYIQQKSPLIIKATFKQLKEYGRMLWTLIPWALPEKSIRKWALDKPRWLKNLQLKVWGWLLNTFSCETKLKHRYLVTKIFNCLHFDNVEINKLTKMCEEKGKIHWNVRKLLIVLGAWAGRKMITLEADEQVIEDKYM